MSAVPSRVALRQGAAGRLREGVGVRESEWRTQELCGEGFGDEETLGHTADKAIREYRSAPPASAQRRPAASFGSG